MPEGISNEGIGASVRRKEDKKFITGKGRYTDDINRPGQLHAWFVRSMSPMLRSRTSTPLPPKKLMVLLLFIPVMMLLPTVSVALFVAGLSPTVMVLPPMSRRIPILAQGKVRYVGDHVVAVIAESLEQARAAAELVSITYNELPAVADLADAAGGR